MGLLTTIAYLMEPLARSIGYSARLGLSGDPWTPFGDLWSHSESSCAQKKAAH